MTNPNVQRSSYARPAIGIISSAALLFALQSSSVAETHHNLHQTIEASADASPEHSEDLKQRALQRTVSVGRTAVRTQPDVYCWDGEKQFKIADAKDRKHKNIGTTCLLATKEDWYKADAKSEIQCLVKLWTRESQFDQTAYNKDSGATGIPQALPGSKMASAGKDWRTNPKTQIKWGLGYIDARYDTPCDAWEHSERKGWY